MNIVEIVLEIVKNIANILLIELERLDVCEREILISEQLKELNLLVLQLALKRVDCEAEEMMRASGYVRIRKNVERTVSFTFGVLTYSRSCWKNERGDIVYPVDDCFGLFSRQRLSHLFIERIQEVATLTSYQKTTEAIFSLTQLSISKTTVKNCVHDYADKSKEYLRYLEQFGEELSEKKRVPIIKIEGDGVVLKEQSGKNNEVHHFGVWEPVDTPTGVEMVLQQEFVGVTYNEAKNALLTYLSLTYNLSETILLTNGDDGKGYEYENFKEFSLNVARHEHFIDRYHVTRKLKQRMKFAKDLIGPMQKAISCYDLDKVRVCLDTLESRAFNKKKRKDVRKLRRYINRNWEIMKPLRLRGMTIKGIRLGAMESLHRTITDRMKKLGRSWSVRGIRAMTQLIIAKKNRNKREIYLEEWRLTFKLADKLAKDTSYMTLKEDKGNPNHHIPTARIAHDGVKFEGSLIL